MISMKSYKYVRHLNKPFHSVCIFQNMLRGINIYIFICLLKLMEILVNVSHTYHFTFHSGRKNYLNRRRRSDMMAKTKPVREKERERENLSSLVSSPSDFQWVGLCQATAISQELQLHLSHGWQGSNNWAIFHCTLERWIGTGAAGAWTSTHMGYLHCKQWLNLLHHNMVPTMEFLKAIKCHI